MDLKISLVFLLAFAGHTLSQTYTRTALSLSYSYPTVPVSTNPACGSDLQEKILNSILGPASSYNKQIPPPPGDVPLPVQVNIGVLNIPSVDEETHQWTVNMYVHQEWEDTRLQYSSLVAGCPNFRYLELIMDEMDSVWKPNLFFPDIVDGKVFDVMQPNRVVRIFPNGHVLYSEHVSVTLYCSGLGSNPGEYRCPMQIFPYGPTVETMLLSWRTSGLPHPVAIDRPTILLKNHIVGSIDPGVTVFSNHYGNFSTLVATFHFLRKGCLA